MNKKSSSKGLAPATEQLFLLNAPAASSVRLAGNFTQWEKGAIPMRKNAGGVWQATVSMRPGEYHYRFLVDGEWCDDAECSSSISNPYGSRDAVRLVA